MTHDIGAGKRHQLICVAMARRALRELRANPEGLPPDAALFVGLALGYVERAAALIEQDVAPGDDSARPDERLIAAAPDLLAACRAQNQAIDMLFAMLISRSSRQAMIEALNGVASEHQFLPSRSGFPWAALQQGLAAIEKATGESLGAAWP